MIIALDNFLNRITMYKLVVWWLRILAAIALGLSALHILHLSFWGLVLSLVILSVTSQAANMLMARVWKIPTNTESYAITLLILFFLLPPVGTSLDALLVALAGVLGVVPKFIIGIRNRHIFNPAAFAAVVLGVTGLMHAIWWVGSKPLWPFVLIGGLLVVYKIRRLALFGTFAVVALGAMAFIAAAHHQSLLLNLRLAITSSPLLFLGTIMLTEPATMPSRLRQQMLYGALVGLLYGTAWNLGGFNIYPETALVIGNLYAFLVNPHYRLRLRLQEVQRISDRVYNYVFQPDQQPQFVPGQYMEWTLDMPNHDSRGNRRTFSIASSPTEQNVQMGVKFYEPSSRFKQELKAFTPGSVLYAGAVAGDFILPRSTGDKLVFIAGGIGITPFRSMLKHLVDTDDKRDIVMIYAVSDASELAYQDVLAEAEKHGVKIIRLLTTDPAPKGWQGSVGKLTPEFITAQIPDYKDRIFYLSGPQPMIEALKLTIQKLGVKKIKTDYFSGY